MELLHKDDIDILDIIIKTCLEKGNTNVTNLPDLRNDKSYIAKIKIDEYNRFFHIIEYWGKAQFARDLLSVACKDALLYYASQLN